MTSSFFVENHIVPFGSADPNYYLFTLAITVFIQMSCFVVAYKCQFDTITDFAGSTNFVVLAVITLCFGGQYSGRQIAATAMLCVTRIELAGFLFYRVLKRGHDSRFNVIRKSAVQFGAFWVFQIIWIWLCSLPVIYVNAQVFPNMPAFGTAADIAGITVFVLGFLLQVVADVQKYKFRSDPANKNTFCDVGVWGWSRHPNYCGEIMIWWGITIACSSCFPAGTPYAAGWVSVLSPLFTMYILLLGSGIMTSEGACQKRWYANPDTKPGYERYRLRTSPLFPFVPAVYEKIPLILKRVFCFELKKYEYVEGAESIWAGGRSADNSNDLEKNLHAGDVERGAASA